MYKPGVIRNLILQSGLDSDVLIGQPLVEISGNGRVLIENHKGIISYNCEELCIRVQYGYIIISGEKLYLAEIQKDRVVIVGKILDISLHSGGSQ